jgi:two-component system nitrogen regulation response regulator GlnG
LDKFLSIFSSDLHKDVQGISPEALDLLMNYSWPGNVREVQNVLKQTLLRSAGPVIIPDFLPEKVRHPQLSAPLGDDGESFATDLRQFVDEHLDDDSKNLYAEALEFMERYVVTRVLTTCDGNQSQAARILGITRGCLRSKVRALNISIGTRVKIEDVPVEV